MIALDLLKVHLWRPEVISYLKQLNPNVSLILFGINKKDEWNQAVSLGVDAIYTDNPYEILQLRNTGQVRGEPRVFN